MGVFCNIRHFLSPDQCFWTIHEVYSAYGSYVECDVRINDFGTRVSLDFFGNKREIPSVFTSMKILLTLSVLLSLAIPGFSADKKPDFSGTWKLNVAKSEMAGSPVESLVVDVDHKDPVFKYTAKGSAGGQDFEETETFYTDGRPSEDSHGATVTAHWEGAMLVSEGKDNSGQVLFTSQATLSDDGKTITRILIQKGPGDSQSRRELYEKQ